MKDLINDLRDDMLEATDLYDKEGVQITRFAMGKGKGTGIQINFSKALLRTMSKSSDGSGYVQIPTNQIKNLIKGLQVAAKSK
tara:strand:+ start:668 stop:916 length:249 start_codon:yes stop_codon:yes gene_type:complete